MVNTREEYCSVCVSPPAASVSTPEKLGWPSHLVAHAPTAGPGGRRRWFQEPAGGPIVPMAWLLLRNDHLVYELCPELKGASFEPLGAKVAELGPPSTSTSPLSWHESRRRRCGARRARRRTTFRGHVLDRALCRCRERPPAERSAVAATCAATGAGGEQQPGRDAHVLCLWVCQ